MLPGSCAAEPRGFPSSSSDRRHGRTPISRGWLRVLACFAVLGALVPAWGTVRSQAFGSGYAVSGPGAIFKWEHVPADKAWREVTDASQAGKPRAYWRFAVSLIRSGLGQEAYGALDLLARTYPEAVANPNYAMARGQALVLMQRYPEALTVLGDPSLVRYPQGCLWRIRAAAYMRNAPDLSDQYNCAAAAFDRLTREGQIPFAVAMAKHAHDKGHYPLGLAWIGRTPVENPEVQLVKARLFLSIGRTADAQRALQRAADSGDEKVRSEAALLRLQQAATSGSQPADQILKALDDLRYSWRDHDVELRALLFGYQLARKNNARDRALSMGATLLRSFPDVDGRAEILADYRKILVAVLDPANKMTLDQSVGLYWEYRDLGPDGAEGDAIALLIARRLEDAQLYARAAQLLQYQLDNRAKDIAKGPLSVRAGILNIRAGQYDYAVNLIRNTEGPRYPADIANSRKQVAAVGLAMLGKVPEALATLEDVPGGGVLAAEILWHAQQWTELEKVQNSLLARGAASSAGGRTLVFRQAVALSMQSKAPALGQLRQRFGALFAGTPEGPAFDLLTAPMDDVNPEALTGAMKNLPTSSPAGAFGDLLNLAPPPKVPAKQNPTRTS